jgi:hypothetical protein
MNRRDIELLISARDTTGRTFQQVASNIESLTSTIEQQVQAAARGEISLQELRQSQEKLAQAGRDLSALQGQIDGYRRLEAQLETNKKAVAAAEANFASFKAEIASSEKVTAAQEKKLGGLEAKVISTGAALRKTETDITATAAALEKAGVDTTKLDQAQTQIVSTARQAGAGFSSLRGAVDSYSDNLRQAATAEAQLAAQNSMNRKIAEAAQLGDASRFVRLYAQAVDEVHLADQRVAALQGFRQVGQMAAEASRDVERFKASATGTGPAAQEVAAGLRAIIDPGREALNSLNGVEAAVEQASATIAKDKQAVGQYSVALNELSEASAALVRQGGLIDTFTQQESAVNKLRAEFDRAQGDVQQFATAMANADKPTEGLVRDLNAAEGKLEQVGRALKAEETRLIALSRSLEAAGIDSTNLAAAQDRLGAAATRAAGALQQGEARLGRNGAKPGGFLGLNPFELQNLSFQIQDIFVGLASGQKPLTILVQQGTQIAGIFPGLIASVGAFALAWLPVIAIIGAVVAAFYLVSSSISELQQAVNQIDLRGLGEGFDPKKIVEASDALEDAGASAEEASEAISDVLDVTSDPAAFSAIIDAATEMADKLGTEVPEAVELLTDVMTGGIEATEALAAETHLLTVEELNHAQALFDAGKAAEARQYILDTVNAKLEQQASLTAGVFTPAVNNLKTAFSNFGNFLADIFAPVIDNIRMKVEAAIMAFTFLTALLAGKSIGDALGDARSAVAPKPKAGGTAGPAATGQQLRDREFSRQLDDELDTTRELTSQERLRRAEVQARRRAQAAGVSDAVEERAVQQAILAEQKKINDEAERGRKKGRTARSRAQREAEKLARQQESAQRQLENQLRQLEQQTGRADSATLEQRLAVVDSKYEKIFDTLQKMKDLGISETSDGETLAEIEARTNASLARLKQAETLKFYEEQINLLTSQRKDEIETITDAQERGAKSVAEAFTEAEAVNGRITPQIIAAARAALAIAQAIAGTNPSPEMVSMIARLERIIASEPTNALATEVATSGLDDQQSKLNDLLAERNDLVEAYNTLNQLGLLTDREHRELTVAAFDATAHGIAAQAARLRETVELLHQQRDALTGLPLLTDAAYNAWIAKLNAVEAGLVKIDDRIAAVNTAAEQAIAQGVTTAFQTAADTIVGLISGTMKFGDAIENVFTAALGIVGQFLQAIAQVLIQMVALQVAKAVIGGSTGGFGALFFHGGGVVGLGGSRRKRTAGNDNFVGAPVLHGGGGLGLRPGEYKAVLQRGEEVLTEDNPRHISNVGRGGQPQAAPSLKQVLLLDPNEVAGAMQSRAGQRSVLTVIRQNKETIKQVLR